MYSPSPIDTSGIALPETLHGLMEALAEQVHETWAKGRVNEGWTYGEERDDKKKTTPCLVPYDALPESEKEYDRATAAETIRFILAHGYKIEKE